MWLARVRVTSGDNVAGRDGTLGARDMLNFLPISLELVDWSREGKSSLRRSFARKRYPIVSLGLYNLGRATDGR